MGFKIGAKTLGPILVTFVLIGSLLISTTASAKAYRIEYTYHCKSATQTILRVATYLRCPPNFHLVGKVEKKRIPVGGTTATTTTTIATNTSGQPQISVGWTHVCLLTTARTVECWGDDQYGALGNGSTTNSPTPVTVAGLSSVRQVSAGENDTCAVVASGNVECWGISFTSKAKVVPGLTDVTEVAVGGDFQCALLATGIVECLGLNSSGLGDGSTTESKKPVKVGNLTNVIQISATDTNACALLSSGIVECWGNNAQGELGDGSTTNSSVPVQVSDLSDVTSISTGLDSTCALLSTGSISCWGSNLGEGAYGSTIDSSTPVAFTNVANVSQLSNGSDVTCMLASGTAECFGEDPYGELGDGATSALGSRTPVSVSGLSNVSEISAGNFEACALLTTGEAYCWGDNQYGELGNGTTADFSIPVEVSGT
jgi:alpha-tubulin suppressor-like RCC1 family protein